MKSLLLAYQCSCCSWNEGCRRHRKGEGVNGKATKMVAMRLEVYLIQVGRKMGEINGKLLAMAPENISAVSRW